MSGPPAAERSQQLCVSLAAGSGGSPAMKNPERPAACLRAGPDASGPALTRQRQAIAESRSPAGMACTGHLRRRGHRAGRQRRPGTGDAERRDRRWPARRGAHDQSLRDRRPSSVPDELVAQLHPPRRRRRVVLAPAATAGASAGQPPARSQALAAPGADAAGAALTPPAMPSPPGTVRDRAAGGASRAARSPGTCVTGKPG